MFSNLFRCFLVFFAVSINKVELENEPISPQSFSLSFLESLMEKVIRMEIKIESLSKELSTERELRQSLQQKVDHQMYTSSHSIAFRAHLSSNLGRVADNTVVKFDQVDLNLGSAYNAGNGTFTAPLNGTYLFSMVLGNPTGNPGAFYLKHNGAVIGYTFAGHTTGWNSGGVTTIADLAKGDSVWVQGEGYVGGTYPTARYHTSFSGVLVHASYT